MRLTRVPVYGLPPGVPAARRAGVSPIIDIGVSAEPLAAVVRAAWRLELAAFYYLDISRKLPLRLVKTGFVRTPDRGVGW